jgi:cysteine synthase A
VAKGTGGTIAGTGSYLKKHIHGVKVILSDPEGSGLYNKVKYNVMFDPKESEGKKRRLVWMDKSDDFDV